MNLSQGDRQKIFAKVSRLVREKHFNTALNGANWEQLIRERSDEIRKAGDRHDFEKRIQDLLAQLRTSHTGFFHGSTRQMPARHAINATFKNLAIAGEPRWIFQDVHEGGAAHAAGISPGDVLITVNEVRFLPPNAPLFGMGQEILMTVLRPSGVVNKIRVNVPNPKSKSRPINLPRAVAQQSLPSGVGYLKISIFPGAIGIDFAKQIDAAIAQLSACDRLIIDLRGNSGGGIGGLRLMSYLTPDTLPVGYSLTRKRAQSGYKREELRRFGKIPSSKAALPWLILKYGLCDKSICLYTEGCEAQEFQGRVVLLVNEHSASAAEMLVAFAEENRLARIVGTKTAGRLLSGSTFNVGKGYVLGIPTSSYLTWQGRTLEGAGILPDVEVDVTYESLISGEDVQLQKAVEVASEM
jgi:carboxyl-terminal processing protease